MLKAKPFFSIITCTLNSQNFVKANIKSVRSQTFKDYEHVFIDGCSSDNTSFLLHKYKDDIPKRVKLYVKSPKGISNAMNEGIKRAKGLYVIFLHSDDSLVDRNILCDAHSFLSENNYPDWIFGRINVVESNGDLVGLFPSRPIYKLFPRWFLKFYNLVPHQSVFIKKSVFDKFGVFDEKLTSSMDVDLWMRIWSKTRWLFWKRTVSNFMVRKEAQSSGLAKKLENDKNILLVRRRYLNNFEMKIFNFVKNIMDHYNTTHR